MKLLRNKMGISKKDGNGLILFYKRHFMDVELVIVIIIAIFVLYLLPSILAPTTIDQWVSSIKTNLYPVVATISGALLGFVITGVSVIIAFSESDKLRLLKKAKKTSKSLFDVYFRTIYYLAATTIIAILGIVIDQHSTLWFFLLVLLSFISLQGLYRCVWILENLVQIIHKID